MTVRWGILGPGVIAGDFARGLAAGASGRLHAVGSRSLERAATFAAARTAAGDGAVGHGSYDEVIASPEIDAVYVATVNSTHRALAAAALEAGKAVLCEKPLTPTADETAALLALAARAGVPFAEAFKYRFGPLADALRTLLAEGAIGDIHHVDAAFGGRDEGGARRLYDPELGGGAILDMGAYPASFAVGVVARAAHGVDDDGGPPGPDVPAPTVRVRSAAGELTEAGVDVHAGCVVEIDGVTATLRTSLRTQLAPAVAIHGSHGSITVPNVWGSRTSSGSNYVLARVGHDAEERTVPVVQPMSAEADAIAAALAGGATQVAQMPWAQSLTTARVLDAWRAALGPVG